MTTTTTTTTQVRSIGVKYFRKAFAALNSTAKWNRIPEHNTIQVVNKPDAGFTIFRATDMDRLLDVYFPLMDDQASCFNFCPSAIASALKGLATKHDVILTGDKLRVGPMTVNPKTEEVDPLDEAVEWHKGKKIQEYKIYNTEGLIRAMTYASRDETRYILNGVCLRGENILGTDGRRLITLPSGTGVENDVIIPNKTVELMKKLGVTSRLGVIHYEKDMEFSGSNGDIYFELKSRVVEGNYPKFDAVIPSIDSYEGVWSVNDEKEKAEIIRFLKMSRTAGTTKTVDIETTGSSIVMKHSGKENNDLSSLSMEGTYFGMDIKFSVCAKLLADGLEDIDSLWIKDSLSPLVGQQASKTTIVIMPCRK